MVFKTYFTYFTLTEIKLVRDIFFAVWKVWAVIIPNLPPILIIYVLDRDFEQIKYLSSFVDS